MKSKFIIFDYNEKQIGHIKNILSAKHVSEVNGEDFLEIETLHKGIQKNYRILYLNRYYDTFHEFIVKDVYEYKSGKDIVVRILAENSIVETMGDFIEGRVLLGRTYNQVARDFLSTTRWQIITGPEGIRKRRTIKIERMNVRAALNIISEQFDLEMKTTIHWDGGNEKILRYVSFEEQRGEHRGQRFTYGRSSTEISRTVLSDELITALYAYGDTLEDSEERLKIDINGQDYVANESARNLFGRLDKDGVTKKHIFGMVEYSGVKTQAELQRRARRDLATLSKPKISYEITVADYIRILESGNNYIELGDTVRVIDRDFSPEIDILSRIIRMEIDLIRFENTILYINDVPTTLNSRLSPGLNYEGFEDDTQGDANDLMAVMPRLRYGLSMWIDANVSSHIYTSGFDNKVIRVNNVVSYIEDINPEQGSSFTRPVFEQGDRKKAPTYKLMANRRWISFNPEEQIYNTWKRGKERPDSVDIQNGEFLESLRKDDTIVSLYIVFYDRSYTFLNPDLDNKYAKDGYRVGYSTPLGYGWQTPDYYYYSLNSPIRKGSDRVIGPVGTASKLSSPYAMGRVREEIVIANPQTTTVLPSIQNLGMNKESYDTYRAMSDSSNRDVVYEQNAFFRGEIGEIIAHRRALDSEEKELIEKYLKNKYNVSKIYN